MESQDASSGDRETSSNKFVILIHSNQRSNMIDNLLLEIKDRIPVRIPVEVIVVQLSPETPNNDKTVGKNNKNSGIKTRQSNLGITSVDSSVPIIYIQNNIPEEKIPAILHALKYTNSRNIILMSDDFSDPPQMLPVMMESYTKNGNCIIIAKEEARTRADSEKKNFNGHLTTSNLRTAKDKFHLNIKDLFSNFVVFPRSVIDDIPVDEKEDTTKAEINGFKILEIPYTFTISTAPKSNLMSLVTDYSKAILYYYKHGTKSKGDSTNPRYNNSVMFISKAIRFYTVGASGLLINYVISSILSNGTLLDLWYMQATIIGILASITSNFFLNKAWTFQDWNFSLQYTLKQFLLFSGISCFGALIQLGLVFIGVEGGSRYWTSSLFSIVVASIMNFLLNKKFTFNERLWA